MKALGKRAVRTSVRLGGDLLWDFLDPRGTGEVVKLNLGTKMTQNPLGEKDVELRKEGRFIYKDRIN